MPESDVKEVFLETSAPVTMEGGAVTRRRGRKGRRVTAHADEQPGNNTDVAVEKHDAISQAPAAAKKQTVAAPVVVLAPAKKKAKVMLVPKGKGPKMPAAARKTFKAKKVHVTIDNTEKTRKRRRQVLGRVDAMTEDQLRAAACAARLSRRESVASVPTTLLRQMLKDYQTMKGNLL